MQEAGLVVKVRVRVRAKAKTDYVSPRERRLCLQSFATISFANLTTTHFLKAAIMARPGYMIPSLSYCST
jgi:hypothetical protein